MTQGVYLLDCTSSISALRKRSEELEICSGNEEQSDSQTGEDDYGARKTGELSFFLQRRDHRGSKNLVTARVRKLMILGQVLKRLIHSYILSCSTVSLQSCFSYPMSQVFTQKLESFLVPSPIHDILDSSHASIDLCCFSVEYVLSPLHSKASGAGRVE